MKQFQKGDKVICIGLKYAQHARIDYELDAVDEFTIEPPHAGGELLILDEVDIRKRRKGYQGRIVRCLDSETEFHKDWWIIDKENDEDYEHGIVFHYSEIILQADYDVIHLKKAQKQAVPLANWLDGHPVSVENGELA